MELMFVVAVMGILVGIGASAFFTSKRALEPNAISRAMLNTFKALRMITVSEGLCHRLVLNTSNKAINSPSGIGVIQPKEWRVYAGNLFICPSTTWAEESSLNDLELSDFKLLQAANGGVPILEEVYGVTGSDSMLLKPGRIDLYFLPTGNFTVSHDGIAFIADEIRICFMNDAEYDTNGKQIAGTEGRTFSQQICLYSFNSMSRSIQLAPDQNRGSVSCLDGGL